MKTSFKILILTMVLGFCISILPVSAKMMDINELGKTIEALDIKKDEYSAYVYVIGEYAFTSTHILTTQDLMLAARSIDTTGMDVTNPKTFYDKMTIHEIDRQDDNWTYIKKLFGTEELETKFNIEFINYEYVVDLSNFNVSLTNETIDDVKNDNSLTLANNNLTGTIIYNTKSKTNYYLAYELEATGSVPFSEKATIEEVYEDGTTKNVTPKSGKKMTVLSEIKPNQKKLTIKVDLDGNGERFLPSTYEIDYSQVIFQSVSQVTFNTSLEATNKDGKTYADVLKDFVKFNGYAKVPDENYQDLKITYDEETKSYKLTGDAVKLDGIMYNGIGDGKQPVPGYYFAFTLKAVNLNGEALTKDDLKDVKITKNDGNILNYDSFDTENEILFFLKLDDQASEKKFKIIVDYDGDNGDKFFANDINIDYSAVNFHELTRTEIEKEFSDGSSKKIDTLLQSDFEFTKSPEYGIEMTENEDGTFSLKGLAPYTEQVAKGFKENHYYTYFVLKTTDKLTDKTTLKGIGYQGETNEYTKDNFDYNGEYGEILFLIPLHKEAIATDKKFSIVIDLDGEDPKYAATRIDFDYQNVTFQELTQSSTIANLSTDESFINALKEKYSGYEYKENEVTLASAGDDNTYTATGSVIKQENVNSDNLNSKTGYYIPVNVNVASPSNKTTLKVTNESNNSSKEYQLTESDTTYPVLIGVEQACGANMEGHDTKTCKATISVDYDGSEKNYFPVIYKIDYSALNLNISSAEKFSNGNLDTLTVTDGYLSQNVSNDTFMLDGYIADKTEDYYEIPYAITLDDVPDAITVTITGSQGSMQKEKKDFEGNTLKFTYQIPKTTGINMMATQDLTNKFLVTIDYDGKETLYSPYDVVVDYSNIKLGEQGLIDYAYHKTFAFDSIETVYENIWGDTTRKMTRYIEKDYDTNLYRKFTIYDNWNSKDTGYGYEECIMRESGNACKDYEKVTKDTDSQENIENPKWRFVDKFKYNSSVNLLTIIGEKYEYDKPIPGSYYYDVNGEFTKQDDNGDIVVTVPMTQEGANQYFYDHVDSTLGQNALNGDLSFTVKVSKEGIVKEINVDAYDKLNDKKEINQFKLKLTVNKFNNTSVKGNSEIQDKLPTDEELKALT